MRSRCRAAVSRTTTSSRISAFVTSSRSKASFHRRTEPAARGAHDMSEPFLGEVRIFPYNFAPRGWAFCQGQLLAISQNTALFSLFGTTYGRDGVTTLGA